MSKVFALLNVQGAIFDLAVRLQYSDDAIVLAQALQVKLITLQTYRRCVTVLPAQLSLQAGCTCTAVQLVA